MKFIDFMKLKRGDVVRMTGDIKPAGYCFFGFAIVTKRYNAHAEIEWCRNGLASVSYKDLKKMPRWMIIFVW